MAGDESTAWLPLGEASQRLGISVDALRARVRRGLVEHRKDNNRRIVVLVGN
jgi:DNA-binding transcriptional MerR regulator